MEALGRTIERALQRFEALARTQPALRAERAATRHEFADEEGVARELGARRHLEWFLFERPSEALQGVPVEALQSTWQEEAEADERDVFEALLNSFASAFVVTRVAPGEGIVVRDLFGVSELAVLEPAASRELEENDLLVGRLFPLEGQGALLSPAVSAIRDANLVAALHRDVERLRSGRRGVLRIQQVELERMFFLPGSPGAAAPVEDPLPRAIAGLVEAGAAPPLAERTAARVAAGADGEIVTEVLNELAFHTSLDLEAARQTLVELYAAVAGGADAGPTTARALGVDADATNAPAARPVADEGRRPQRPPDEAAPSGPQGPLQWFQARAVNGTRAGSEARPQQAADDIGADAASVRAALESFDQGRADGRDLEELFGQLEAELELGPGGGADDEDAGTPDFPGVVGAMVAEYRWESEATAEADAAQSVSGAAGWRLLEAFARATDEVGVFEDLTPDALVRFAARDALDQGLLQDEGDATTLLRALEGFARWCDENHGLDLRASFAEARDELAQRLPRLAEARDALGAAAEAGGAVYEVAIVGGSRLALRALQPDDESAECELQVSEPIARHLEHGDLVRVRGARVVGVHPPAARASLAAGL